MSFRYASIGFRISFMNESTPKQGIEIPEPSDSTQGKETILTKRSRSYPIPEEMRPLIEKLLRLPRHTDEQKQKT